jgi:hypothetical protein
MARVRMKRDSKGRFLRKSGTKKRKTASRRKRR